ncbi:DUF2062 domain-containing protein [Polycladidibacter hongkongensis]|uniref:DUF2062 domain-containing protein n=1 Tax=Polycladidibacter hongkongensis TaxID=1647556 RepID=UPI0008371328|nr:DUF2062 domain-containing protein [Pseudovibrio hongkongensis]
MLFKRRQTPSRLERLRVAVWPRRSWLRSAKYFGKRVLRLSASPHTVSMGFACGAAASITPFVGFHFIFSFILAFVTRGNMLAAALGTAVGNPLTFPFIWATTYKLGSFLLYQEAKDAPPIKALKLTAKKFKHADMPLLEKAQAFLSHSMDTFVPMLVGSLPLALICGLAFYFPVRRAVEAYQRNRFQHFQKRRAQHIMEMQDPEA